MKDTYVGLWVSKEYAEEVEKLKGTIPDNDIIQGYIEKTKKDVEIDLETLDHEILQYRAKVSKWQKDIRECYSELNEKSYKSWEDFDKGRPVFEQKMKSFVAMATPVNNLIKDIEKSILSINTWNIDKMLTLIQRISTMSAKEKDMLSLLLKHEGSL